MSHRDLDPGTLFVAIVANHWNPTDLHVALQDGPYATWSLNRPPVCIDADHAWEWAAYAARVLRRWHRMRAARDRREWLAGWAIP